MRSEDFLQALEGLSLEEMVPILDIVQKKVDRHRVDHRGFLPVDVWLALLKLYGSYVCFEALIRVYHSDDGFSYALKKRDCADQGWQDHFSLPGVVLRPGDMPVSVYARLCQEITGGTLSGQPNLPEGFFVEPAYVYLGREPERGGVTCLSLLYQLDIFETQMSLLPGCWRLFKPSNLHLAGALIVPEHERVLEALEKNGFHKTHAASLNLWFFYSPRKQ